MQDAFTRKPTRISGRQLPSPEACAALQDDHDRRLAALAGLIAAAEECGLRTDSDRDFVLLSEDEERVRQNPRATALPWELDADL